MTYNSTDAELSNHDMFVYMDLIRNRYAYSRHMDPTVTLDEMSTASLHDEETPRVAFTKNLWGQYYVFEAARRYGVKRLFFVNSFNWDYSNDQRHDVADYCDVPDGDTRFREWIHYYVKNYRPELLVAA